MIDTIKLARTASFVCLFFTLPVLSNANPLLQKNTLPDFEAIKVRDFAPALNTVLQKQQNILQSIPVNNQSWDNAIQPLIESTVGVTSTWALINYISMVNASAEMNIVHNQLLHKVTGFYGNIMYNTQVYNAYKNIAINNNFEQLPASQQQAIRQMLNDFKISGANLDAQNLTKAKKIQQELNALSQKFTQNITAANKAWQLDIPSDQGSQLDGLPDQIKQTAAQNAKAQGKTGWVLTLQSETLLAVESYAKDRNLREQIYKGYSTIASDQGPETHHSWDNSLLIKEILNKRQELAVAHGFKNYAEYILASQDDPDTNSLKSFLQQLANKIKPAANAELTRIQEFARKKDGLDDLKPWDIAYYSEWYKSEFLPVAHNQIAEYFTAQRVLDSFFTQVNLIYAVKISGVENPNVWHPSVKLYVVNDNNDKLCGYFYLDLFAREHKRNGYWFTQIQDRMLASDKSLQLPLTIITTNFGKNQDNTLHFAEVVELFGLLGQMLQATLSLADYPNISGINTDNYNARVIASEFMQEWAWQYRVVQDMSKNVKTGMSLPESVFNTLVHNKNYNSALALLHTIELALFDLEMHTNLADPMVQLRKLQAQIAVAPHAEFERFPHSNLTLFAGDNFSPTYARLWLNMLAADAFAEFLEAGLFNPKVGKQFKQTFLEQGGQISPLELFEEFRGRAPNSNALLKQSGIDI